MASLKQDTSNSGFKPKLSTSEENKEQKGTPRSLWLLWIQEAALVRPNDPPRSGQLWKY